MPATAPRPSFLVFAAALAAPWRRPADVPGEARRVSMDGWGVPELVRHLEARGLGLRAVPTGAGGSLSRNTFLTVPGKRPTDLTGLMKTPAQIDRWEGVVYYEHSPRADDVQRYDRWGDCHRRIGPFWFFGDPELLAGIQEVLREPGPLPEPD